MRAVYLDTETRRWVVRQAAVPRPAEDEVLIRTRAVGLNHADLLMRDGTYVPSDASWRVASDRVGFELSGVVEAVGQRVSDISIGDRVMAQVGGAAAELVSVPAVLVLPTRGVDDLAAGGLPSALLTEYDALRRSGAIAGAQVMITGGSSAVGRVGIQLARILGAAGVAATTRSADKGPQLQRLGADEVIVTDRSLSAASNMTPSHGYDVVLDHVGGRLLEWVLGACRPQARVIQIGRLGGTHADVDLELLAARRVQLIGTTFRGRTLDELAALTNTLRNDPTLGDTWGGITTAVDSVHDLADVESAAAALEHPDLAGKVILTTAG